jgi:hypothetical protein
MTDVGENVFSFTHQTFLEYFFARFVDEKADTVKDVLDEVLPHVLHREWDVVAHLTLQIKTHRSPRRQNQAIEFLLSELDKEHSIEEMRALVVFAARALEYLAASETQVKALVERIFDVVTSATDDDEALLALRYCSCCCAERQPFVSKLLLDLIVASFKNGEQLRMSSVARALSSEYHRSAGIHRTTVLPRDLLVAAQSATRATVLDRLGKNDFFAGLAWSWFDVINEEALRKHGLAVYFNAQSENNRFGVDGLTTLVLAASDYFSVMIEGGKSRAEEALAIVGQMGFTGETLARSALDGRLAGATAPLPVWYRLLKSLKKNPTSLAGAFYVFLLVTEFAPIERVNDVGMLRRMESVREKIMQMVLGTRTLKKLDFYPSIVERAAQPLLKADEPSPAQEPSFETS